MMKVSDPDFTYEFGVWRWGAYWSCRPRRSTYSCFEMITGHKTLESFYKEITNAERARTSKGNYKWNPYWEMKSPFEYGKTKEQIRQQNRGEFNE